MLDEKRIRRTLLRIARPLFRGVARFSGKIRRAYLCLLRPRDVQASLEIREGACNHCGNCCRISFDCPFLQEFGSHSICRIYHIGRPAPCAAFPINRADLADVDFLCSFSFSAPQPAPPSALSPRGLPVWNTRDALVDAPRSDSPEAV